MRLPKESSPIRTQEDLEAFEKINLLDFGIRHKFTKDEIGSLFLAFRIYACAYHELVLTGRMPAHDYERLCRAGGVNEHTIREARMVMLEKEAELGLVKEGKNGEYEYDSNKLS